MLLHRLYHLKSLDFPLAIPHKKGEYIEIGGEMRRFDEICTFCFDDGLYMLGGDIVFYVY